MDPVESAIEEAVRRGDFDDLPASYDPDWWVKQRIANGEIDPRVLLPVVVLLRKEYERRDEDHTPLTIPDSNCVERW